LARYNTNGSLDDGSPNDATPDDTFGTGGFVAIPFTGPAPGALAVEGPSLALEPDGSILFARTHFNGTDSHHALARYTTTGTPDTSFGSGTGAVTINLSGSQYGRSVAIQPDGKLVVVGVTTQDTIIARLQPDGTLDTGFGSGGIVIRSFSSGTYDGFVDVALQADGKIVAVGTASIPVGRATTPAFLIARYQASSSTPSLMTSRQATNQAGLILVGSPSELLMGTTESEHDLTMLATELVRSHTKRSRPLDLR
jgi:uncharacterized delta-60 repeat protein